MSEITVEFEFEKSTKNTHRYAEVETGQVVVGTLYVQKLALAELMGTTEPPAALEVAITILEG